VPPADGQETSARVVLSTAGGGLPPPRRAPVLIAVGSVAMVLGMLAIYALSYWSYSLAYTCAEPCPPPPTRIGEPILSVDRAWTLVVVALLPLLTLVSRVVIVRLAARGAVVALPLSSLVFLLVLVPTPANGIAVADGPLPGWSFLSAVPLVWGGGACAWKGLASGLAAVPGASSGGRRSFLEAIWSAVAGLTLLAVVVLPVPWTVSVAISATSVGALFTAWAFLRPASGASRAS